MSHFPNRRDIDKHLAIAVMQGNKESLGLLYDKYAPALFGIILNITKNEKKAEDILKITFINIRKQIAGFNAANCSLFTWLFTITRQTALAEVKNHEVRNPVENISVYGVDKKQFNNTSSVDEDHRLAFNLVFFGGLNFKDAANKLNMPAAKLISNINLILKTSHK